MKCKDIFLYLSLLLGISSAYAQVSPDCVNAIPICSNTPVNGGTLGLGVDDFNGALMSGCLEEALLGTIESNSAWYHFRTGASGQLGFNIGFDIMEDWDFALYKTSDCANLGDPIRCNFYDNQDEDAFIGIGEDPTGQSGNVQYEDWLPVESGEDYYLLINNFSNQNSGFSIQFSGNIFVTNPYDALDCSIINNLLGPPITSCENEVVVLDATTTMAIDYDWFEDNGNGFQPISGVHDPTLQVTTSGMYRVNVIMPSNNNLISDVQVYFSSMPVTYPISDDASCSGSSIYDLSQKDIEVLGSQNVTEFLVSYYNSLADAMNGTNVLPKNYITGNGAQTIYVRVSSISNPQCFDASQQFQLINLETPEMDFETDVYLCESNSSIVIGEETSPNSNYTYSWDSGESTSSISVSQAGSHTVTSTNHQGGLSCSKTKTITVTTGITPNITDIIIEDLRNDNSITIMTNITGDIEYQLDDGTFQAENTFTDVLPGVHSITVNEVNGCGVVTEQIVVVGFPKFFTPNGDGNNDLWHIQGISNLENPVVFIYDRFGKLLKQLNKTDIGWNGSFINKELPSSDYWFKLTYVDATGQRTEAKYINNHFSLKR